MDRPASRRSFLRWAAAAGAAGLAGCRARGLDPASGRLPLASGTVTPGAAPAAAPTTVAPASGPMPAAFVGHGAPTSVLDPARLAAWTRWTGAMRRPTGIVVVSAHWRDIPVTIGATTKQPLVYDFYGFPDEMYALRYDAPPSPALATEVERRLAPLGRVTRDEERWLDHGAWCPLLGMYPRADVPCVPLSFPTEEPDELLAIGRALAPLREQGVLILASGNLVHNLRRIGGDDDTTPSWAAEFDAWCAEALVRRDLDALVDYRRKAPGPNLAHPTKEHFIPLFVALGAAEGAAVSFPVTGFEGASISRRCVQLG